MQLIRPIQHSIPSGPEVGPDAETLTGASQEEHSEARRGVHEPALRPGQRLGTHVILAQIAAGGMGEVYRARDTRLGRDVAVKVLRRASASPANCARLKREAQVLARLSHPGIAAIHGQEQGALVMELVEGSTLAQRIKRGPIPLAEALEICRQIADTLEYVHSRGVIHRDLKPSNIMLTPAGGVKLLDFGLSKVAAPRSAIFEDPEESPTMSLSATRVGSLLGTSAYMSPEQARGHAVDKSTDIWAFGVVFYEMLTGVRLFAGQTLSDTLALILTLEPDLERVPAAARKLLLRCLCKESRGRLRDIGDVRLLLEDIDSAPASSARRRVWMRWLPVLRRNWFGV